MVFLSQVWIWFCKFIRHRILVLLIVLFLAGCRAEVTQPVTHSVTTDTAVPNTQTAANLPTSTNISKSLPAASPIGYTLAVASPVNQTIDRYALLELDLQTNLQVDNPFDPSALDLKVHLIAPSGKEVQVGAFWYQGYDLRSRQRLGKPTWKVRFTPDETGLWKAYAVAPALHIQSELITFQVADSNRAGFIHVNPDNPRYLAYDNGDFFFPIGLNMGWWGGCCDAIQQYRRWLERFTQNGGNTIRVWMAAWSFGVEWKDTGLGDYSNRLYEAWLLDQLFELAESHNVKIILVLVNHGPFSLSTNSEWDDNPYNAALGGPLSSPDQFVTDPLAKTYFQRRLNYIINRWGYSTSLLAWEWFNEVNLTPITDASLVPWIQEMTAYLHQRDVNHHLTTISFAMRCLSTLWQLPELDIIQKHEYSSQIDAEDHDLAARAPLDFQALAQSSPPKPILLGEFGFSAENYGDDVEKTGIHLHNGLWATTFSGYAGTGMYWWWDIYIEANDLWRHFNGLSQFMKTEDLTHYVPFSPLIITDPAGNSGNVVGLGLQGPSTLVWIRSNSYTTQASIQAQESKPGSSAYIPPLQKDLTLTLPQMLDAEYVVDWYDPQTATWIGQVKVATYTGTLIVPIPAFRDDIAAKIALNP